MLEVPPPIRQTEDGVRFPIHVQPRAKRTELAGRHGDSYKLRVAAPAVEDAANRAVLEFFAGLARVPRASVRIVAGRRSREKTVQIDGLTPAQLLALLGSPGQPDKPA